MATNFFFSGDEYKAKLLKGFASKQLSILLDGMRFNSLQQDKRTTLLDDGSVIVCNSSFGNNTVFVMCPVTAAAKKAVFEKIKEMVLSPFFTVYRINDNTAEIYGPFYKMANENTLSPQGDIFVPSKVEIVSPTKGLNDRSTVYFFNYLQSVTSYPCLKETRGSASYTGAALMDITTTTGSSWFGDWLYYFNEGEGVWRHTDQQYEYLFRPTAYHLSVGGVVYYNFPADIQKQICTTSEIIAGYFNSLHKSKTVTTNSWNSYEMGLGTNYANRLASTGSILVKYKKMTHTEIRPYIYVSGNLSLDCGYISETSGDAGETQTNAYECLMYRGNEILVVPWVDYYGIINNYGLKSKVINGSVVEFVEAKVTTTNTYHYWKLQNGVLSHKTNIGALTDPWECDGVRATYKYYLDSSHKVIEKECWTSKAITPLPGDCKLECVNGAQSALIMNTDNYIVAYTKENFTAANVSTKEEVINVCGNEIKIVEDVVVEDRKTLGTYKEQYWDYSGIEYYGVAVPLYDSNSNLINWEYVFKNSTGNFVKARFDKVGLANFSSNNYHLVSVIREDFGYYSEGELVLVKGFGKEKTVEV